MQERDVSTKLNALAISIFMIGCFVVGAPGAWAAARVAVLPFQGLQDKSDQFLKEGIERIISSRLGVQDKILVIEKSRVQETLKDAFPSRDQADMKSLGLKLDADFLLAVSVNKKGEMIIVEANLFDLTKQDSPSQTFDTLCRGLNEVIGKVSRLTEDIRNAIIIPSQGAGIEGASASTEEMPSVTEERIEPGEPAGATPSRKVILDAPPPDSPAEVPPAVGKEPPRAGSKVSLNYSRSETLGHFIRGLAVADADGDGKNDVVVITESEVVLYHNVSKELKKISEYKEKGDARFLKVDAGDINGNGKAEIFVTSLKKDALCSFVLEHNEEGFAKIAENVNLFFGVVNVQGEVPVLVGQKYGDTDPLQGEVWTMRWESGTYMPLSRFPQGVNAFALGVLGTSGSRERKFVTLGRGGHLLIYGEDGTITYESDEAYGGSESRLEMGEGSKDKQGNAVSVPPRLIIIPVQDSGIADIIVGNNFAEREGKESQKVVSDNGFISALQWNGNDTELHWRTGKLEEYVADYAIADVDNDGKNELVVAVNAGRSHLTFRPRGYILAYKMM